MTERKGDTTSLSKFTLHLPYHDNVKVNEGDAGVQTGATETSEPHNESELKKSHAQPAVGRSRFATRFCLIFAALVLLSGGISLGGKWTGRNIALAGHSNDVSLREIIIGNDVLNVPANMIRFETSRRDGDASRLDLYLRWPQMDGYSDAARNAFNHADGDRNILFLTFEPRMMSRDMSGRYQPIYRRLIDTPGRSGPGGLSVHRFSENTGYIDEVLVVENTTKDEPFVMRCLSGTAARESLAPCERDIFVANGLSLTYRMPARLAGEWRTIEAKIREAAARFVKMDAAL